MRTSLVWPTPALSSPSGNPNPRSTELRESKAEMIAGTDGQVTAVGSDYVNGVPP